MENIIPPHKHNLIATIECNCGNTLKGFYYAEDGYDFTCAHCGKRHVKEAE